MCLARVRPWPFSTEPLLQRPLPTSRHRHHIHLNKELTIKCKGSNFERRLIPYLNPERFGNEGRMLSEETKMYEKKDKYKCKKPEPR